MATKIDIQKPAIDASIAIAGGQLIDNLVVGNIAVINDALANLPADIMGVSLRAVLLGATALVITKNYIMK